MRTDTERLGRAAFEQYGRAMGGRTYDGKPIPKWEEVGEKVREGWRQAAHAVVIELHPLEDGTTAADLYPHPDQLSFPEVTIPEGPRDANGPEVVPCPHPPGSIVAGDEFTPDRCIGCGEALYPKGVSA